MRKPVKINHILARILGEPNKVSSTELLRFFRHYTQKGESALIEDIERATQMFDRKVRRRLTPPAGLSARQAVPIMLAYVREDLGKDIAVTRDELASLSALAEALDRRFGDGFTERVINELNAMPSGARSMHYPR